MVRDCLVVLYTQAGSLACLVVGSMSLSERVAAPLQLDIQYCDFVTLLFGNKWDCGTSRLWLHCGLVKPSLKVWCHQRANPCIHPDSRLCSPTLAERPHVFPYTVPAELQKEMSYRRHLVSK